MRDVVYKYALQNAFKYGGKASVNSVISKVLAEHPELKKDMKILHTLISELVNEVNLLSLEEQTSKLRKIAPELMEEKKKIEEKKLPELPKIQGEVITRLPPEPSKYTHLGHALSFLLNYTYAKKHDGKFVLSFENTNPNKVSQEYIDAFIEAVVDYLGIKVDGIKYVSDDMSLLYSYAEELIKKDKAYMCFCNRESMQNLRHDGKECNCRKKDLKTNLKEWKKFLVGNYKEGECTLRIKGDMKSKNHVMRDSVIFRRVDANHYKYKDKYKIWPMYDFYNSIEDSIMGITLILRSNEFDLRVELQDYIKDLLGLKKQIVVHYGRFNVMDFTTKGREIREFVESGELIGWDDPRLITLKALRRRGITREAIYELTTQLGLSKQAANIDFDMIAAINRKIIDSQVDRYSFVLDPIEITVKNKPEVKEIEAPIHPDKEEKRKIRINKIFISSEDLEKFKDKEIRLLHLYNIKLKNKNHVEYTSTENKPIQKINWVSYGVDVKIFMPDGKWIKGLAESSIKNLKLNQVVQFERFGFVKLDKIHKNNYEFWFTHK